MWYLYLMIGVAAVCIGVPLFLIYWTDKRSKRSFEKSKRSFKKSKRSFEKRNKKSDDMKDLDHY